MRVANEREGKQQTELYKGGGREGGREGGNNLPSQAAPWRRETNLC